MIKYILFQNNAQLFLFTMLLGLSYISFGCAPDFAPGKDKVTDSKPLPDVSSDTNSGNTMDSATVLKLGSSVPVASSGVYGSLSISSRSDYVISNSIEGRFSIDILSR